MKTTVTSGMFVLVVSFSAGAAAFAADPPSTADVLANLHHSNQKEVAMGQLAQKNAQSKDVKSYGKTLVKDHRAADKKVLALAKQEKIDLPADDAKHEMVDMGTGADFDARFSQAMLDDHKKDVAESTAARDATSDDKLKALLTAIVPTLQKHKDSAQALVDKQSKK